jgi:hypothetical protein
MNALLSVFSVFPARWLIPPVVGALIGFATNVIALKMLFRPLRELRIFGIRLPFTPGILPRERRTLALSIGAMTEKHLLTGELIRERLDDAEFKSRMLNQVSQASGHLLSGPLAQKSWFVPRGEDPSEAARFLARLIRSALDSPLLDDAALSLSSALLEKNSGKTLRDLLGGEKSALLVKKLAGLAASGLGGGAFSAGLAAVLNRQYPFMVRSLTGLLRSGKVHRELETQGKIFLSGAILKLNALQRFFISAGQYDRTLNEKMGDIVDDFIEQLETNLNEIRTGERVIAFLLDSAEGFLERSGETQFSFLEAPLSAFLDKTLDQALALLFPASPEMRGEAFLEKEAARLLTALLRQKSGGETSLALALDGFFGKHREHSLYALLGFDGDKKAEMDRRITHVLLEGAKARAETILASLDIKTIVAAKIDSLDMLEVEKIVLDIMAGKLKWIDIFGAILGALIGLSQVLLGNFFL